MRAWLAGALLIFAGAGEASAQVSEARFCTTLRQLLPAAHERPAFASFGRTGRARAAAGLGFRDCRVEAGLYGDRLTCTRFVNPREATGAAPETRIAQCLPEALPMAEPEGSRLFRFRLGTLALSVDHDRTATRLTLFAVPVEHR